MLEILIPLMFVAGAASAIIGLEPGDDSDRSDPDPNDEDEVEPSFVDINEVGSYSGGDQDDVLHVGGDTGTSMFYDWDGYAEHPDGPANEVCGGAGDDKLLLSGSGYRVFADEGADLVDVGDASHVAVYAGADDTVIGGIGEDVYVRLEENATFEGREGNDFVISSSTSPTSLGQGDDTYIGVSGNGTTDSSADIVYGGAGNDFIAGSVKESNLWHAHPGDQGLVSFDTDILYGGSDADTLLGSHGDQLYGGEGHDTFITVLNIENHQNATQVMDFEPGLDQLEVRLGQGDLNYSSSNYEGRASSLDLSQQVDANGDTVLLGRDGQELVRVVGVGNLKIGIDDGQAEADSKWLLDLNGEAIEREFCDIVVKGQFYE